MTPDLLTGNSRGTVHSYTLRKLLSILLLFRLSHPGGLKSSPDWAPQNKLEQNGVRGPNRSTFRSSGRVLHGLRPIKE